MLRPAEPSDATWVFLVLPMLASAKLPTRSMTSVDGTLNGQVFQATLSPDGGGSHWLKVEAKLCEAACVEAGDTVDVDMRPVEKEPQPEVPTDVRNALAAQPAAKAQWETLTAIAQRDWIHWITSGKKAETRLKRIDTACDLLGSGKRRACCFDRSGIYSKGNMGAPKAAE